MGVKPGNIVVASKSGIQVPPTWSATEPYVEKGQTRRWLGDLYDALQSHAPSAGTEPGSDGGVAYWNKWIDALSPSQTLALDQSIHTLTDATNVTPDFSTGNNFSLLMTAAIGATRNLKNPTAPTVGQSGFIDLIQSSAGGNSVVFDTYYKFPNETDPTQDTTASTASSLVYFVKSATEIRCQYLPKWGRPA